MTPSFSGVISPPGTRGTTEYSPPRCMFARKRSFVSCSVSCSGFMMSSFHRLARIEATAGLQISQPWPRPQWAMISPNVRSFLAFTMANNSVRESGKCSHKMVDDRAAGLFQLAFKRSVTSGTQPPQPVPAFVQLLSASSVSAPSRIAAQIAPFDTLLQEQTWAESGIASRPIAAPFEPLARDEQFVRLARQRRIALGEHRAACRSRSRRRPGCRPTVACRRA